MLKIKYKNLILVSYAILLLPILLFFLFWLRFGIGVLSSSLIIYAAYKFYVNNYHDNVDVIELKTGTFVICSIFIFIWLWSSNVGDIFVSGYDWPWRNAMFNDLVNYKWPIIYKNENAFIYYHFFWLCPAFVGKIMGISIAKIIMFSFTYIFIMFVIIHLYYFLQIKNTKFLMIITLIFIFWSGLNIVGQYISNVMGIGIGFNVLGAEHWSDNMFNGYSFNYLFRSNSTVIREIYNQLPIWLVTILFISSKKLDACIFICLLAFPYAPLPFIGLIPFACIRFAYSTFRYKSIFKALKESFSLDNIIFIISFIPIFLYFSANSQSGFIKCLPLRLFDPIRIFMLLLFYLSHFGILFFIIRCNNKYKQIYYTSLIFLLICPFVEFGHYGGRDFVMNASIPSMLILMVVFLDFFINQIILKQFNLLSFFSVLYIVLMSLTTIGYFGANLSIIKANGHIPLQLDYANVGGTLEEKDEKKLPYSNYLVPNYKEKLFYKYFAERSK